MYLTSKIKLEQANHEVSLWLFQPSYGDLHILYGATYRVEWSRFNWLYTTLGSIPDILLVDIAKRYALALRYSICSFFVVVRRSIPIWTDCHVKSSNWTASNIPSRNGLKFYHKSRWQTKLVIGDNHHYVIFTRKFRWKYWNNEKNSICGVKNGAKTTKSGKSGT